MVGLCTRVAVGGGGACSIALIGSASCLCVCSASSSCCSSASSQCGGYAISPCGGCASILCGGQGCSQNFGKGGLKIVNQSHANKTSYVIVVYKCFKVHQGTRSRSRVQGLQLFKQKKKQQKILS